MDIVEILAFKPYPQMILKDLWLALYQSFFFCVLLEILPFTLWDRRFWHGTSTGGWLALLTTASSDNTLLCYPFDYSSFNSLFNGLSSFGMSGSCIIVSFPSILALSLLVGISTTLSFFKNSINSARLRGIVMFTWTAAG